MTPAVRDAVGRHGLAERVRILGRVGEELLATLYSGADLFVMPNIPVPGDMEGFGVVMLEAGLNGLPVLAADDLLELLDGHLHGHGAPILATASSGMDNQAGRLRVS